MDVIAYSQGAKANKRLNALLGDSNINIPSGTTAERPTLGVGDRAIRFNTTTSGLEEWGGTEWKNISASITAVNIKGSDTAANILAMAGMVAEDLWIASDTLDGYVYDGATWINLGPLQGPQGVGISSITLTGTTGLVDTYTITYSNAATSTITVTNGQDGATWLEGAVNPTTEGSDGDFYLNTVSSDIFKKTTGTWGLIGNLKGATGDTGPAGKGIASITRTAGDGSAGTLDTYTITYTDATTSTFQVQNGANGVDGNTIDHVSRTAGTGLAGSVDTYTMWEDVGETVSLGTFEVVNGIDGGGAINDATITTTTLWSSEKINNEILAMAIALS